MTSLNEIERAIQDLDDTQLAKLREWFLDFDAQRWDEQFEQDANAGRLDDLGRQALADLDSDRCTDL